MRVEIGLEFTAIVSPDFLDVERELVDGMVNEIDGVGLGVMVVDLEHPNTSGIVDCRILEPLHGLTSLTLENQEFDIHLEVTAGLVQKLQGGNYVLPVEPPPEKGHAPGPVPAHIPRP